MKQSRCFPGILLLFLWSNYTFYSILYALVHTQSCLTLCDPVDCGPPGSSGHGIFQARILEWATIFSSRGSSRPRARTRGSCVSCIGRQLLYHCATWGAYDSMDVGNLISGSSAFSKSSLCIWKVSVHVLLKPSLKDFEHYFACM